MSDDEEEELSVGEIYAAREAERVVSDLTERAAAQIAYDDLERSGFLRPRPCGCNRIVMPGGDPARAVLRHTCGLPDETMPE